MNIIFYFIHLKFFLRINILIYNKFYFDILTFKKYKYKIKYNQIYK